MIEVLFPDLAVNKVQDIDLDILVKKNIKGLILDIDNTLVATETREADFDTVSWLETVKKTGLKACIVSNSSKKRVEIFNGKLNIFALHRATKPSKKSFLAASKLMGVKPEETAVIGDQIFTDIYGGRKSNMYTILVKPIDKKEFIFVRLKRLLEKPVLKRYYKKISQMNQKMGF
jgi:hypothetical protein